jgi:poly(3-hydroxybutyrate) depolymerase
MTIRLPNSPSGVGRGQADSEVFYITVDGLGHTWAVGKSLPPEFMVGRRSDKIKATDVIWDFFQKHLLLRANMV